MYKTPPKSRDQIIHVLVVRYRSGTVSAVEAILCLQPKLKLIVLLAQLAHLDRKQVVFLHQEIDLSGQILHHVSGTLKNCSSFVGSAGKRLQSLNETTLGIPVMGLDLLFLLALIGIVVTVSVHANSACVRNGLVES